MRHRIATITLGTVIAAGLAAGCSGSQGIPQPSSGAPGSPAPTSSSSGGAPHVANPLDTTKFQANPCSLLSAADAQPFGLPAAGQSKQEALGPMCVWDNQDTGTSVFVRFVTANKDGLSSLYRQRESLGLFRELSPIGGYPAVIWGQLDSRSRGTCDVSVGVTDRLDYNVGVQATTGPLKADPCGTAQKIATTVLGHLKGGS